MIDKWTDPNGEMFVDFSGSMKSGEQLRKRSRDTEYGDTDLASGYPKSQIWITKDRRRIAIPNFTDQHLLNTIAYLRRRSEFYKKRVAVGLLINSFVILHDANDMFNSDEELDQWYNDLNVDAQAVWDMPSDDFLRKYIPIFPLMLQECYKRKLLIEVDNTKVKHGRNQLLEDKRQK